MPNVGDEEFAYTPQGIQAAKQKSAATGIPVSNAAERSVVNHAGTGQANFNSIGQQPMNSMQQPMYKKGGKVKYEDGGKVKDQRVKDYEDRFKNKEQKATKELAPAATKKRKRVLPKAGKKPKANTNFQNMPDKEIMELMDSQQKYEEGGKVKERFTHSNFPDKSWDSEDHFYEDVVEPEIAAKEKAKADAKAKKDKQASDKKIKDRDKKDKEKGAKKYGPSWGASDDMPGGSGRE